MRSESDEAVFPVQRCRGQIDAMIDVLVHVHFKESFHLIHQEVCLCSVETQTQAHSDWGPHEAI